MISRSGTRSSGASLGATKILREEGSGPVVTAVSSAALTVLFMAVLPSGDVFFSAQISQQAKQQSGHAPDRGGDRYRPWAPQRGQPGSHHPLGREQARRAADRIDPAEQRDQHAPVGGP